jgi:hypothetical protein
LLGVEEQEAPIMIRRAFLSQRFCGQEEQSSICYTYYKDLKALSLNDGCEVGGASVWLDEKTPKTDTHLEVIYPDVGCPYEYSS